MATTDGSDKFKTKINARDAISAIKKRQDSVKAPTTKINKTVVARRLKSQR